MGNIKNTKNQTALNSANDKKMHKNEYV